MVGAASRVIAGSREIGWFKKSSSASPTRPPGEYERLLRVWGEAQGAEEGHSERSPLLAIRSAPTQGCSFPEPGLLLRKRW